MARDRIWPKWSLTVSGMIEQGACVKASCRKCGTVFKVDLEAIAALRGGDYSLIDRTATCRIYNCDGECFFMASASESTPLRPMLS